MSPPNGPASTSSASPRRGKRLTRRVLPSDPGQEYLLYVPSTATPATRLVVSIHGAGRNADEHARLLAPYCEMYGVVLAAPLFLAERYPDYQRLGRRGRGRRADLALNVILGDVATVTECAAERVYLFGVSGGAQFAHRYLMAHPHRVARAVCASGGWYTHPDPNRPFPHGIRWHKTLPDLRFDAEAFLHVPITVLAENDDTGLLRTERLDREQGVTRLERARCWVEAMHTAAGAHRVAPRVRLAEIENGDRSFKRAVLRGGLGDAAFAALFGPPPATPGAPLPDAMPTDGVDALPDAMPTDAPDALPDAMPTDGPDATAVPDGAVKDGRA